MANILEFENRLKTELSYKANSVKPSEELPQNILYSIEKRHMTEAYKIRLKKYITAIACAVLVCVGTAFISSTSVQTMAMGIIRTVFVLDSNDKVVEKPANEVFLTPLRGYSTEMSDEEISKKMGISICFPQTICGGFQLTRKSDGVGLIKPIPYDTYNEIAHKVENAIKSEQEFNTLDEYHPYRSIGGVYENGNGVKVGIYVYDRKIPLPNTNTVQYTEKIETKVAGMKALWLGLEGLNNSDDLTQKTTDKVIGHTLFWTTDHASYNVAPPKGQTLTLEDALKYAEAFMAAQK